MTDQPTNHYDYAESWLDNAVDWYSQIPDTEPAQRSTASALIAGAHFLGAFVAEDDADDPADDDTVEIEKPAIHPRQYGLGHIPDADIVAGLGPTWDNQPGGAA